MSAFEPAGSNVEPGPSPSETPEAEDRVLGRLDFALNHLRTRAEGTAPPPPLGPGSPDAAAPRVEGSEAEPSRLTPERARTVLALAIGSAHLNAGSLEAAEREFRDALASDPDNADARSQLARTLALLETRARGAGNS
jgi:Tetratricopeptide repeat